MNIKQILGIAGISLLSAVAGIWGYGKYTEANRPLFESKNGSFPVNYASFLDSSNRNNAASGDMDFTAASMAATPATVHIKTLTKAKEIEGGDDSYSPLDDFFGPFGGIFGNPGGGRRIQPEQRASGSGAIITKDGYIVTNNHVVQGTDNVTVTTADLKTYTAKVVGTDPSTDIAVLKIEGNNLPYLMMGNSDDVKLGQWVLAVGYPLGLDVTVTAGIVSAMGRSIDINRKNIQGKAAAIESFIQTDAAVNQGNSGGPLINTNGQLIGINSALASPTGAYAGYSYAIPVNLVKKAVNDLIKFGVVQRGYLGISYGDIGSFPDAQKKELNIENFNTGLYVSSVSKDGAADRAGLKKGDVITKVEGTSVRSSAELSSAIGSKKPGDKISMDYIRSGKAYNTNATLQKQLGDMENEVAAGGSASLGATLKTVDESTARKNGIRNGVQVTNLKEGVLRKAGVANGFIIIAINNQTIKTPQDIDKVLQETKAGYVLIKGVYSDGDGYIYQYRLNLSGKDTE